MPSVEERLAFLEQAVAQAVYGGTPEEAMKQWDEAHKAKPPEAGTKGPQLAGNPEAHKSEKEKRR
jgi:hypothetical protein